MAKITYTNKVTLNPQPSIADENKVTSGDMNEIKNVVNGLIVNSYSTDNEKTYSADYLNNNQANAKILWTNPNPGNAISSDTTITLSSDDYDVLKVYCRLSTANNYACMFETLKGYGVRLYYGANYRTIDRNSDTSYTIKALSDTQGNTMIPQYIVGYKTGLFS